MFEEKYNEWIKAGAEGVFAWGATYEFPKDAENYEKDIKFIISLKDPAIDVVSRVEGFSIQVTDEEERSFKAGFSVFIAKDKATLYNDAEEVVLH